MSNVRQKKTFVWTRKRVLLGEALVNSPHSMTPSKAARRLGQQRPDVLGNLHQMEAECLVEADRPYDPDLLGTERTFTIAAEARDLVTERIARFRRRYPLKEWRVESQCPIPELSEDEIARCMAATPQLQQVTQKPGTWTSFVLKINAEDRHEAMGTATDQLLDTWENVLKKPTFPCGVNCAVAV